MAELPEGLRLSDEDMGLLSLSPTALELRWVTMTLGYEVYSSLLGHGAPRAHRRWDRMVNPQVGDWVMEITTWHKSVRVAREDRGDFWRGFGLLESIGEDVYFLRYGPADEDVCSWENAQCIALPVSRPTWWLRAGELPEESSV